MNKLFVSFLVVGLLLFSLVLALDNIVVTAPTSDQKVGSTVDVKWDTTQIPKGLKTTGTFYAIVAHRERTYVSL